MVRRKPKEGEEEAQDCDEEAKDGEEEEEDNGIVLDDSFVEEMVNCLEESFVQDSFEDSH